MKYISLIAVVAIALVIGWFILTADNSADYVALVTDDVSSLEAELATVAAQTTAGTLTPAEASEAKGRIIKRIEAIEASANAAGKAALTVGQRQQLADGLTRLKQILLTYQAMLTTVEVTAAADNRANPAINRGQTLTSLVVETIDSVETVVADAVPDYQPDASVDAAIDAAVSDADALYEETATTDSAVAETSNIAPDTTASTTDTGVGNDTDVATSTDDIIIEDDTATGTEEIAQ